MPVSAFSPGMLIPLPGADLLFVSGQLPLDKDRKVVAPNDPKGQAEKVFENVRGVLAEAGMSFEHVVKAQIFLTNMKDFPLISEVRNKYFAHCKPATSLVEVSKLVREDCCVEIEVVAIRLHA